MGIILTLIAVVVAIIILLLLIAAFTPKAFHVERKININSPADKIYKQVNSFQKWEQWSPWLQRDPTIKNSYSGPEEGVGNKVSWLSKKSGNGSMEIIENVPAQFVRTKLQLNNFTPFEGHFSFKPADQCTEVSWADIGSMSYPWNIFNLFADKMMGKDFEAGLVNLKKHVEGLP